MFAPARHPVTQIESGEGKDQEDWIIFYILYFCIVHFYIFHFHIFTCASPCYSNWIRLGPWWGGPKIEAAPCIFHRLEVLRNTAFFWEFNISTNIYRLKWSCHWCKTTTYIDDSKRIVNFLKILGLSIR